MKIKVDRTAEGERTVSNEFQSEKEFDRIRKTRTIERVKIKDEKKCLMAWHLEPRVTSSYFLSASSAICLAWANCVSNRADLSSSMLALFSRALRILNEWMSKSKWVEASSVDKLSINTRNTCQKKINNNGNKLVHIIKLVCGLTGCKSFKSKGKR